LSPLPNFLQAALICALFAALAACGAPTKATDSAALEGPSPQELLEPGPLGEKAFGNPKAPVTLIEYASLTCPYCKAFHRDVFPRLKRDYIDTGKIRYVIREYPIGRTAGNAAIVTRCVADDRYLGLVHGFLERQAEWVSQEVRHDAIFGVAKDYGMTRETFDKCLANQSIIDGLTVVKERGRKFGVIGTPTFFVNGQKAQGTVTYEQIKAMIEPGAS
jgi:protein-disulfide isomerase